MNHKRKRPKNRRSGCLMCKPNKVNGANNTLGHKGFGKLRAMAASEQEVNEAFERTKEKYEDAFKQLSEE